ncbi:uncharacterized protein LOC135375522 [Ornithodoros turicata]|uniref:uncharacterized protein LOC135375522 n=1 Tax=Ornithodoros turicata TaxID=34597 RepID=UPI00313932EB
MVEEPITLQEVTEVTAPTSAQDEFQRLPAVCAATAPTSVSFTAASTEVEHILLIDPTSASADKHDTSLSLISSTVSVEDGYVPPSHERLFCGGKPCEHELQIVDLRRRLNSALKKVRQMEKKMETLEKDPRTFLSSDQIRSVENTDSRANRWDEATVLKALKARLACGRGGYEFVKEHLMPLPSERTLQRKIENVKFGPGMLKELLPALKVKLEQMRPQERRCAVLLDEMQLTPGPGQALEALWHRS